MFKHRYALSAAIAVAALAMASSASAQPVPASPAAEANKPAHGGYPGLVRLHQVPMFGVKGVFQVKRDQPGYTFGPNTDRVYYRYRK